MVRIWIGLLSAMLALCCFVGCGGADPQYGGPDAGAAGGSGGSGGTGGTSAGGGSIGGAGGQGGSGLEPCGPGDTCPDGFVCVDGLCHPDQDNDGFSDAFEQACGSDPNDDGSVPDPSSFQGAGDLGDPYRVCMADQIYLIGEDVGLTNASYLVTRDIDMSQASNAALMIGSNAVPFMGNFDGSSYSLSNTSVPLVDVIGAAGVVADLHVGGTIVGEGGVALRNDGTLSNVHFDGSVTGSSFTGGLVGVSSGTISNCSTAGTVGEGNHIGGLVGSNDGEISRSHSSATVAAGNRVGGLVGSNSGPIEESYVNSTISGSLYVGGLVGTLWDSTITDSYVQCGLVTAVDYPAGLVGSIDSSTTSALISRCYAACPAAGNNAQGLIGTGGEHATSIDQAYWDLSLIPVGAYGTGVTHQQMQQPATFSQWDFTTPVWKFETSISPFPVLAWQTSM